MGERTFRGRILAVTLRLDADQGRHSIHENQTRPPHSGEEKKVPVPVPVDHTDARQTFALESSRGFTNNKAEKKCTSTPNRAILRALPLNCSRGANEEAASCRSIDELAQVEAGPVARPQG
jgi:hypothetical protein